MKILPLYDSKEQLPKEYASLYEEKDGKFVLTGVEGLKTQADIDSVLTAKQHEVDARKKLDADLKALSKKYEGIDVDEYNKWKTEQATAKLKKENPDANLDYLKLKNDYDNLLKEREDLANQVGEFKSAEKASKIKNALLKTARELKFNPVYDADIERYASDFNISESGEIMTNDGKTVNAYFSNPDFNRFVSPSSGGGEGSHTKAPTNSSEREQKYAQAKKDGNARDMMLYAPETT